MNIWDGSGESNLYQLVVRGQSIGHTCPLVNCIFDPQVNVYVDESSM